jgi:hypothetical protein
MKALKIIGIVLGSIVLLVVIVVGVFWILMSRPSKIAAKVTPVVSSAQSAQSLDTKWSNFNTEVAAAQPDTKITVAITQEEVNSKVNEALKTTVLPDGLTVDNLNVNLVDGKIILSADVNYSVFSGNAGMEATVQVVDGKPTIDVSNIDMGALPIPQALKDQLKDLIPSNGLINMSDLGFDTQNISIVNGQMVISGVTK